jgi:hypothetical protein
MGKTGADRQSRGAAEKSMSDALSYMESVCGELGRRAQDLKEVIRQRLQQFLVSIVDGALALVRPQLDIGGNLFALSSVSISHTLKMTGSIKASLEEVCELVSEGQIEVGAEYEKADAPKRAS